VRAVESGKKRILNMADWPSRWPPLEQ